MARRGTEVKSTGDGIMAVFTSAADGTACAELIQQGVARLRRRDPRSPTVRVGVSCGEATSEDGDWYGTPVIEAARLCAEADGGQVLTTAVVAALVGARGGHVFVALGERTLKGFEHPTSVIELEWKPAAAAPVPLPPAAELADGGLFIGRDAEYATLAAAWKEAQAGRRQAVVVAGEPGVGKSRLAARLARDAHADGGIVLWGRCDEELAAPYQPVAEALRHWAAHAQDNNIDDGWELGRLFGSTGNSPARTDLAADPEGDRLMLFDAIGDRLRSIATDHPLLVVLDDLHWATAPTLTLIRHFLRDPRPAAMLIVATYRDTELDRTHPLAAALADWRRETNIGRVAVKGLSQDEVVELIEAAAGETLGTSGAELAGVIHDQTEGNPFFIGQVLRHLTESGALVRDTNGWRTAVPLDQLGIPEGVREVIGRRLSRLSEAANRVLAVASVIGREFDMGTLETVADPHEVAGVLERVEEAVAAHLVDEVAGSRDRVIFAHALVRQTLLAELTSARRTRMHRMIGEALRDRRGASPAVVAYHLCEGAVAETVATAIDWSGVAMRAAFDQTAFEEVVSIGKRALGALELAEDQFPRARSKILAAMATSAQYSGEFSAARELADEAIAAARQTQDPLLFAEAVDTRFNWGRAGMPDPQADKLLSEAIDGLSDDNGARKARLLATRALQRGVNLSDPLGATLEARQAVALARQSNDADAELLALFVVGSMYLGSSQIPELQSMLDEIQEVLTRLSPQDQQFHALTWVRPAVVARLMIGDRSGSQAAVDRIRPGGDHGLPSSVMRPDGSWSFAGRVPAALMGMWDAMFDLADGRLDSAQDHSAALLAIAANDPNFQNSWATLTFRTEYERGQAGKLLPLVQSAVQQTPGLVALRAVLALALLEAGRLDEARQTFLTLAVDGFANIPRDVVWSGVLSQLAEVCLALGDHTSAASLYEHLLPFTGQVFVVAWGVYCPGAADRYLGALAGLLGRHDQIDGRFAAALALEEQMAMTALAARTRVWWARALVGRGASGDADRARTLLHKATIVAEPLGLVAIAREAADIAGSLS